MMLVLMISWLISTTDSKPRTIKASGWVAPIAVVIAVYNVSAPGESKISWISADENSVNTFSTCCCLSTQLQQANISENSPAETIIALASLLVAAVLLAVLFSKLIKLIIKKSCFEF
jgi:hypothetical protein